VTTNKKVVLVRKDWLQQIVDERKALKDELADIKKALRLLGVVAGNR